MYWISLIRVRCRSSGLMCSLVNVVYAGPGSVMVYISLESGGDGGAGAEANKAVREYILVKAGVRPTKGQQLKSIPQAIHLLGPCQSLASSPLHYTLLNRPLPSPEGRLSVDGKGRCTQVERAT